MSNDNTNITNTTVQEGFIYEAVPEAEAPPAYVPTAAMSVSDIKEKYYDDEHQTCDHVHDDADAEEQAAEDFEIGLFGMFSYPKLCVTATFCSPCLFARTSRTMQRLPHEDPVELENKWSTYFNSLTLGYALTNSFTHGAGGICWRTLRRGDVRAAYNIKGNVCTDFLKTMFLRPCALAQEDFEVSKREQETFRQYKQSQLELQDEYLV